MSDAVGSRAIPSGAAAGMGENMGPVCGYRFSFTEEPQKRSVRATSVTQGTAGAREGQNKEKRRVLLSFSGELNRSTRAALTCDLIEATHASTGIGEKGRRYLLHPVRLMMVSERGR